MSPVNCLLICAVYLIKVNQILVNLSCTHWQPIKVTFSGETWPEGTINVFLIGIFVRLAIRAPLGEKTLVIVGVVG